MLKNCTLAGGGMHPNIPNGVSTPGENGERRGGDVARLLLNQTIDT